VEKSIKAECRRCNGNRECSVKAHYAKSESNDDIIVWTTWNILECKGCGYDFVMRSDANSEEYEYKDNQAGEVELVLVEHVEYWPAVLRRPEPEWLNSLRDDAYDHIRLVLRETYGALNSDLPMLAAIGVRTCFDVASELCGVEESLSFQNKLVELEKSGKIDSSEKARLEILVDAGGASAHRGWVPSHRELDTLVDLLEHFLFETFVKPATKARLDKEATALKSKVPPRKKKP